MERCNKALRRFIEMVHQRGMKVLAYVSTGFFDVPNPDFRQHWSREGDSLHVGYFNMARCSPSSTGWRAYLLPRIMRVLDDNNVDGIYIDCGYVTNSYNKPPPTEDEVIAFEETPTHDGALADLLALIHADGFAANGYGAHSPGGYSMVAGLVAEIVLTFMFLFIILGSTDARAPAGLAPIAIGLGLTLIHLVGIPVTNLSVNPARSTAPAIFVGGWALTQLWLFWVAPIVGGILAGVTYRGLFGASQDAELPT